MRVACVGLGSMGSGIVRRLLAAGRDVAGWNRTIAKAGVNVQLALPSPRFRRSIGSWAGQFVDPSGKSVGAEAWHAQQHAWLPSDGDRAFVKSLMQRVIEPGKMAAWIAPPDRGINNLPVDYEYVRLH
jgi:benzoyl-CoA 2,3-dioxygenase component B